MGNKIKKTGTNAQIGQLIVDAWKAAKDDMTEPFVIKRNKLMQDLINNNYIDPSKNTGGNNKKIVFDLVFDTDLDANTRLVWIAIPTPDAAPTKMDWENYINGLTNTDIQKIGESVLFGCGR